MKDSFAFALPVDNLEQGTALRIALADHLASTWKYRSTPVLRTSIKATIPLLRRARKPAAILLEPEVATI